MNWVEYHEVSGLNPNRDEILGDLFQFGVSVVVVVSRGARKLA